MRSIILFSGLLSYLAGALTINEIWNGNYSVGDRFYNVSGLVTYKWYDNALAVRSTTPNPSTKTSNSAYLVKIGHELNYTVGAQIIFDATVAIEEDTFYLDLQDIRQIGHVSTIDPVLVGIDGRMPLPGQSTEEFWRSLQAEWVLLAEPTVLEPPPGPGGIVWVRGQWKTEAVNNRGGLTQIGNG
jgi:hypothetical protein